MAPYQPLRVERTPDGVAVHGALTLRGGEAARQALAAAEGLRGREMAVDLHGITALDTVGALWLLQMCTRLSAQGKTVNLSGMDGEGKALLERVAAAMATRGASEAPEAARYPLLARIGRVAVGMGSEFMALFSLLGEVVVALGGAAAGRRAFRWNALVRHVREAGVMAVPIVALISFLMSIVLAYQGVAQLRMFGAQQYAINLVAVAVLREMGGLLAAIMVAGRSGSSFTSEIGVMKIREEVDALAVMGMRPLDVMILPRVVALVLVLPVLTLVAFVAGLLGGALVSVASLGVGLEAYLKLFAAAVSHHAHWIGLVKAPVFALFIGLISCLAGLRVAGSAESVGRQTTRAVVQGIFAVLVLDALFSVFFSKMGW